MASLLLPRRFRFGVIAASSTGITKTRVKFSCFSSVPIRVTTRDHTGQLRTKSMSQSEATSDSNSSHNDVEVKTTTTTKEEEKRGDVSVSEDVLVQYVVLRRDLIDTWPMGSVVTQGCHASVSAIWSHKDDPHTLQYCSPDNIDSMHKVTLEVKGQTQMVNLSEKLTVAGIAHKLWIEQPENFPTCLATKPYPKSLVSSFFKKLKLCK